MCILLSIGMIWKEIIRGSFDANENNIVKFRCVCSFFEFYFSGENCSDEQQFVFNYLKKWFPNSNILVNFRHPGMYAIVFHLLNSMKLFFLSK